MLTFNLLPRATAHKVAFRTNDDVFPLLTDILLTYWDPLLAQEQATGVSRNEEPMSSFQAVNVSIDTLLQEYEQLTGNVLIKDSSLAANALPISISVPKPVPRSELVRIIASVLLLNNYALIPGPDPKTIKVINMNSGKNPRSEGLPLYVSPAWPSRK
jgi:type II secretory pathway component GspD/PulD (secretin)